MSLNNRGLIFRGEPASSLQSAMSPDICVIHDGRWLCSFRTAEKKSSIFSTARLTWSDDEGQSWSQPVAPWPVPRIGGRRGCFSGVFLTALDSCNLVAALYWVDVSNPNLSLWDGETESLLDSRIFLSRSSDCGQSWSQPEYVDTYPITLCVPLTGPILRLNNGDWGCQFEINKPYGDPSPWRHASVIAFSHDEGKTWPLFSVVTNDPQNRFYWWDQRPTVLRDGTIISLFWTLDNEAGRYVNIHACKSCDHGRTWSKPWDTGIPGQPSNPVQLPDGRIALPYVDRTAQPKIMMRCSNDGGHTWPKSTELTIYASGLDSQTNHNKQSMEEQWAEMQQFSVGLPSAALLPGGDVLVVYYTGPHPDMTGIEWTRITI